MTTTNDLNNNQLSFVAPQQAAINQTNHPTASTKEDPMILNEQLGVTADLTATATISEPDTDFAEIVASSIGYIQQGLNANAEQLLLIALTIEASYVAEVNYVPSVLKIKVGESGHNVDDIADVLAQQAYLPITDQHLQSALFKSHCRNSEYATCISAYKGNPAKHMRNNNEPVPYGTQFIVHEKTLAYKDGEEGLIDTVTLAPLSEGAIVQSPNDFSHLEKAKLAVNNAKRNLWLLQNKQRVKTLITNCTLPHPENVSEKVFNAWKPILVLGSLLGQDKLNALNALMQTSNVAVDNLSKDTALLIDMKVLTERAKSLHATNEGIASAMLIGQLKSLAHQQWGKDIHAKYLSDFMGGFDIKAKSVKHDYINTSGYLFNDLETLFETELNLAQPLQQARHDDVTAMIMTRQAA